ncbi:GNAT family N-acetyltransferase [Nocardioides humi]|uniref:GNAT family N-acetyltransferase n=1 Tax=Nocardioides humi TaxID=449461 RepID=A0ABN1ZSN4_9ACTN|nr:GNAT family N-acetyltransferase [Nocardioides humi]
MTVLVPPDSARWLQWAAMVEDFGGTTEMHGSGYWHLEGDPVPTAAGCAAFVTMTEATASADLDGTRVASTYFWIAGGDGAPDDDLVGFLHLRHTLNAWLFEEGGHIGYSVRPAARRRGHASRALALGVRAAAGLGIERVLVTCDVGNDASRRTIEAGGGRFEDERNGRLRFWIPAAGAVS